MATRAVVRVARARRSASNAVAAGVALLSTGSDATASAAEVRTRTRNWEYSLTNNCPAASSASPSGETMFFELRDVGAVTSWVMRVAFAYRATLGFGEAPLP